MFKEGSQFEPGQAPEPDQTAILAGILRIWEGLGGRCHSSKPQKRLWKPDVVGFCGFLDVPGSITNSRKSHLELAGQTVKPGLFPDKKTYRRAALMLEK